MLVILYETAWSPVSVLFTAGFILTLVHWVFMVNISEVPWAPPVLLRAGTVGGQSQGLPVVEWNRMRGKF